MKKFTLFFMPVVALSLLASCVDNTPKTFTVTWLNADGVLLKRDENVKEGTLPVYEGKAPTLPATEEKAYYWDKNDGWTTEIVPVHGNQVYMAKFKEMICDTLVVINVPATLEEEANFGLKYECDSPIKVDWGDGSPLATDDDGEINHTYEHSGDYDIRLYSDEVKENKEGITGIAAYGMPHVGFIKEIYFGATITHVDSYAFWDCENLTYVQFFNNDTFTSIGHSSFYNTNISSIDLPDSLLEIGDYAFRHTPLTSITIPDKVTELNSNVFRECYYLTTVNLNHVKEIDEEAFRECTALENIIIPNSVEKIYYYSFFDCNKLTFYCEINNVPAGWEYNWNFSRPYYLGFKNKHQVGDYEFLETSSGNIITKYSGEDSIVSVPSELDGYEITAIGEDAFRNNNKMTEVEIPSSIKTINYHAFMSCDSLTKVNIDDGGHLSICEKAFTNCYELEEAIIPDSVWKMEFNVFSNTPNVTIYCIRNSKPESWNANWNSQEYPCFWGFREKHTSSDGIYEFIETESANVITKYLGNAENVLVPNKIDDYNITEIGVGAFKNNGTITKVDISESISVVNNRAFTECNNLKTVNFPASLTLIGASAFKDCVSLEEVNIPDNGEQLSIKDQAFYDCRKLATVIVPIKIYEMGMSVFGSSYYYSKDNIIYCKNEERPEGWSNTWCGNAIVYWGFKEKYLAGGCEIIQTTSSTAVVTRCLTDAQEITIPEKVGSDITVNAIGDYALYGKGMTKVVLPNSIKSVGSHAFAHCLYLNEIVGFDSVVSISDYIFLESRNVKTVALSSDPISIADYAFFGSGITYIGGSESDGIIIPENVVSLGKSAFEQSRDIKRVVWPKTLDVVTSYCFYECENLETVIFAENSTVTKISARAFEGTKISEIDLPNTLITIDEYAFEGCKSLTSITIPGNVTSIGHCVFWNCSNLRDVYLTAFTSPTVIPSADETAFNNCPDDLTCHVASLEMANAFKNKGGGWPQDLSRYDYPNP